MITSGWGDAISIVGKLVDDAVTKDTRELITDTERVSARSVRDFVEAVLRRDVNACNFLLGQLQHGVPANLTQSEYQALQSIELTISGAALVRFFSGAEGADLAVIVDQIVRTAPADEK